MWKDPLFRKFISHTQKKNIIFRCVWKWVIPQHGNLKGHLIIHRICGYFFSQTHIYIYVDILDFHKPIYYIVKQKEPLIAGISTFLIGWFWHFWYWLAPDSSSLPRRLGGQPWSNPKGSVKRVPETVKNPTTTSLPSGKLLHN